MAKRKTILLYGRTGAGKTPMVGELAEHVFATTGKKTRLYTGDRGGTDTIQAYIDLGIIELVEMGNSDPWIFINQACQGRVRDAAGKWVPGENSNIGLFAFESIRAYAESLMEWMKAKSAAGVNIGGGGNVAFKVAGDGITLTIGGSNQAHYGIAQGFMQESIWASQNLDADYIMWTSSISKDDDMNSGGKVLGPDAIGRALTPELPRWFDVTARIDVKPAMGGGKESHVIYLGIHADINAGGAAALGNIRLPLDAKPLERTTIEPASIVRALQVIAAAGGGAKDAIRKRLGDKLRA